MCGNSCTANMSLACTVNPPNTAALRMGEKAAVLENGGKGSHLYNQEKTYIQDLKIIRGMGVWGGGGQRRGSIGGTTVTTF